MFNFYSPSRRRAFRVTAQPNLTPEQLKFLRTQGRSEMQSEELPTPYSPFTLPLPDKFVGLEPAIAAASASGIERDCEGQPVFYGCTRVTAAELHTYWTGVGESGKPVWKITFGQDTKAQQIARQVDAGSGQVVAMTDMQGESIGGAGEQRIAAQSVGLSNVGRDLGAIWPVVNAAIAKQDPLFKVYAVAATAKLSENRQRADGPVSLRRAYFAYARLTPSFRWDELEVQIEWTSNSAATMRIAAPTRRSAPEEAKPIPLSATLPDPGSALPKLIAAFPNGYYEQFTTYERGCRNVLTVSPNIRETECGVLLPIEHHTDEVFFWLSRQGNPYWRSQGGPLQPEYRLIGETVPHDKWIWWTRVKQHGQWQYHAIDASSGAEAVACSPPIDASSDALPPTEPCR